MNIDTKMLNKIQTGFKFVNFKNVTYYDQISFILEIQRWFNLCKAINVINYVNGLKAYHIMTQHCVSTDTEKAFDRF